MHGPATVLTQLWQSNALNTVAGKQIDAGKDWVANKVVELLAGHTYEDEVSAPTIIGGDGGECWRNTAIPATRFGLEILLGTAGAVIGSTVEAKVGQGITKATFANTERLIDHFERHGKDFGIKIASEYEQKASEFLLAPKPDNVLEKIRESNGDVLRYNQETGEFGVLNKYGIIKTYYKPKRGIEYFNDQR